MKILVYGSINIDMVFSVNHIVKGGETLKSSSLKKNAGGKGANQAVAFAKAGGDVYFAGHIGEDGKYLKKQLEDYGVKTDYLKEVAGPTGQAIIQLDKKNKQNSIIILAGANDKTSKEEIDEVLSNFSKEDYLVLQNEITDLVYLIDQARKKKMKIVFNPSPFEEIINTYKLNTIDYMIVNELEAAQLLKSEETDYLTLLNHLAEKFPTTELVLTAGSNGAYYRGKEGLHFASGIKIKAQDTTAAGDTFLGYFITFISEGNDVATALGDACYAAGLCVSKFGAQQAIPLRKEVRP